MPKTFERTEMDDHIDLLIAVLEDRSPNRAMYYNAIKRLGMEAVNNKAAELRAANNIRNRAAVFFAWVKKQPDTPKAPAGEVVVKHLPDDPLDGLDEAIARL